jgi:hypothetical protein
MGVIGDMVRQIIILSSCGSKSRMGAKTILLTRSFEMMASRVMITDSPEAIINNRLASPYRYKYKMHRCAITESDYIGDNDIVYEILGVNPIDMLFIEVVCQRSIDLEVPDEVPEGNQGNQGNQL